MVLRINGGVRITVSRGRMKGLLPTGGTEAVRECIERAGAVSQTEPVMAACLSDECSVRSYRDNGPTERSITLNPRSASDLIKDSPEVCWLVDGILSSITASRE